MTHNVFVNEHIVMLADSFTRKRAMHINIAKVIFSVENTNFSLSLFNNINVSLSLNDYITKKAGTSSQRFLLYGCY